MGHAFSEYEFPAVETKAAVAERLIYQFHNFVNNLVKLGDCVGTPRSPAGECICCGVEESPRIPVVPKVVEAWLFPLAQHLGNTLNIDYLCFVHAYDGMVR